VPLHRDFRRPTAPTWATTRCGTLQGTQAAGFGMMIRIDEPDTLSKEKATGKEYIPDRVIVHLADLLEIFPART
jgi:hypothetical protein